MYRIGIDLGGTNIVAGVVVSEFKIVAKLSTPTNANRPSDDITKDIASLPKRVSKVLKIKALQKEKKHLYRNK